MLVAVQDGRPVPKVIDFGVAKAVGARLTDETMYTELGAVIGTLEYMAPEQAELSALDVDTRAGVYALGGLLFELLTGTTPLTRQRLKAAGFAAMLRAIKEVESPKPSTRLAESKESLAGLAAARRTDPKRLAREVRGELDWIVQKALEKDRTRRYDTANGFSRDVQRYLADEVVEARPPSAGYRLRKLVRRNKGQVVAASFVLFALLAGIAGTTFGLIRANRFAEAERLAKLDADAKRSEAEQARDAEAERAEGERLAKLDAVAQAEQARKRLTQVQKANAILGSIFENLDPKEIARAERPLQAILVEKLDQAVAQLEGEAIGDPMAVATMQDKFGLSLVGLGEPGKAIALLEKARATCLAELGPDHFSTLTCMNNLSLAYRDAGKRDLALPLLEETLKLRKARIGPDHPQTLASMANLGRAYLDGDQGERAAATFKEVVAVRRKRAKPDDPQFAGLLALVALDLLDYRQHATAEGMFHECPAIREKTEPDVWTTFNTRSALGGALLGQRRYAEAEPLLLAGYEGMKAREKTIPPEVRGRLGEAADRLVELYVTLGQPAEVKRWRAERATHPFVAPPPRPANRP